MSYPCPLRQLPKGRGICGLRCSPAPPPPPHTSPASAQSTSTATAPLLPSSGTSPGKGPEAGGGSETFQVLLPKGRSAATARTDKGTALPGGVITREGDPGFIARTHTEQVNPTAHSRASPAAPGLPDLARERACCPLRTRSEPQPPAGSPGPFEITCFLLKIHENFAF